MAGERSIRLSFEAQEELSRAVQQIDKALDQLKGSLSTLSGVMEASDISAEQLESSLDEVGDEAAQASVRLTGLISALAGLEATSGMGGVNIPIEVDDPSDVNLKEVQTKVAAKLRDDPAKFDLGADVDHAQLATEIEEASAWINEQVETRFRKPNVAIGVDLDEAAMIEEVKKIEREAEEVADDIDLSVDIPEEEMAEATGEVQQAISSIEESKAATVNLKLRIPDGQQFSAMGRVAQATKQIEESDGAWIDLSMSLPIEQRRKVQSKLKSWAERVEGYNYTTIDIKLSLDWDTVAGLVDDIRATKSMLESIAGDVHLDLEIDATDEAIELAGLIVAMNRTQAAAFKTAAASRAAASGIDKMGDEASKSAAEMTALQSIMNIASLNTTALSLNVGAFNIALGNLLTQIPILIGLLGTLATVILGVAGAATIAASAFAGLVAGGFIAELTRVEEQFDNIENKAEAMQAIMRSLQDVLIDAFEPMIEAGSDANAFFNAVNGALETINVAAKATADSMEFSTTQMENFIAIGEAMGMSNVEDQIMSLSDFFGELGTIWQDNVQDIIRSIEVMSAFLLPVLADIIEFFIAGFDDMILFITQFTKELTVIGPAVEDLIGFAVQLVDLGSTILQGLLPVIVGLIGTGINLVEMLNEVDATIIRNIVGITALAVVVNRAYNIFTSLADILSDVVAGTRYSTAAAYANAAATEVQALAADGLFAIQQVLTGQMEATTAAALFQRQVMMALNSANTKLTKAFDAYNDVLKSTVLYTKAKAAADWLATGTTGTLAGALGTAMSALWGYVASAVAGIASTLGLTGAYLSFSAATGGLATALPAIATALLAIVTAGGASVAMLSQTESATSGLSGVLSTLKTVVMGIVSVFVDSFISVGESMLDIFNAVRDVGAALGGAFADIGEALGLASGEGSGLATVMKVIQTALEGVLWPFELLYSIVSVVARFIGAVLSGSIQLTAQAIVFLIGVIRGVLDAVKAVINQFLEWAGVQGDVDDGISATIEAIGALKEAVTDLPETIRDSFDVVIKVLEDMANFWVNKLNDLITAMPEKMRKKLGIETLEQVELISDEASDISKGDVATGTGDAKSAVGQMTGRRANEFNYNEENINNTSQEINADPEEKGALKRVVKDAMREAESFSRRQEGGM